MPTPGIMKPNFMFRTNQAKPFFLCWWDYSVHYPIQAPENLIELYHLAADLGETRNLSVTNPETTQRLKAKLEFWLKSSGARMPVHVSTKP